MSADFAHLHVASGFSMRYGASMPAALVERAAELGQPSLGLTDRDGLYGAVRFAGACERAGIDPVLGVDLAVREDTLGGGAVGSRFTGTDVLTDTQLLTDIGIRTDGLGQRAGASMGRHAGRSGRIQPAKGGALVDDQRPRVTILARGQQSGLGAGAGWGRLCQLVTRTHLSGERGSPITTPGIIAGSATTEDGQPALVVLLGPDSDVGRALLHRRWSLARELLRRWQDRLPTGALVIEVVCHGGPSGTPASVGHAARLWGLALESGLPAVLTAAVRHATPQEAMTVDVLDAARRMVPLDERHLDRLTTAGHLAPATQMHAVARQVAEAMGTGSLGVDVGRGTGRQRLPSGSAGRGRLDPAGLAEQLVDATLELAAQCRQDPRADLGIGSVHLPEPEVLGLADTEHAQSVLAQRCRAAIATRYAGASTRELDRVASRLEDELTTIAGLGYPTYFMTVAEVCDLIRDMGVRVAARGSGAGSVVNYLLGISGVEPLRHELLMERFCSPLRAQLPDIDVDVESARRTEIYERILERFGSERVTCVSMMETYRVRHAIRDVASTLGLPPAEIDVIAKAFPHIRARDARAAIRDLPELRAQGLDAPRMQLLFELVERLDGLPRHIALHPCGVVLSNRALLERTPVEASWLGFPMSQFDKDDVEELGLLKLDVLGVRMQSSMAHAVEEVARVDGIRIDLDARSLPEPGPSQPPAVPVPLDDPQTFALIQSTRTLGCFQIESPGQRELVGKFAPETFEDIIIDISLFRPGPVKSDMIRPFLMARQGWQPPQHLHPTLVPHLSSTQGVVVFHEQVLQIVSETTGVSLAEADEVRRAMGTRQGQDEVEQWWRPAAAARGYDAGDVDRIWEVLRSFASFGFCKAHAAAFALPTYQSAWLKAHHPAAFLAGVLTHDPGMYPRRLILDDARNFGVAVLGLDVNASGATYRVERVPEPVEDDGADMQAGHGIERSGVDGRGVDSHATKTHGVDEQMEVIQRRARQYGIRLSLADVKGITEDEVDRVVAGQPYQSLADFWQRARVSRPVVERLVAAGGFDSLYGLGSGSAVRRRGQISRRDLLLHVAELDRWSSSMRTARRSTGRSTSRGALRGMSREARAAVRGERSRSATSSMELVDVASRAASQAQGRRPAAGRDVPPATQLTLDLGDTPELTVGAGLPEMTEAEQVRAELDVLGMDVSAHVMDPYAPMLEALGATRSSQLLRQRNAAELLVAGAKVATQTPPVRSGRRVVFLTLDDATGPVDATFFEDVQGPYAATVFHSWLLLVRGVLRRTGPRGVSLRATGAWELSALFDAWEHGGLEAVQNVMEETDALARHAAQASAGGRRVLVHASGFRQSPYADTKPAGGTGTGGTAGLAPSKLWHSSPGSPGH